MKGLIKHIEKRKKPEKNRKHKCDFMVRPSKRTTHLRKIFYRTPSGKTKTKYERKKSTKASCAICKKLLQGVSTKKKLSKTMKKPGRLFSGNLCVRCTEQVLKYKTRIKNKDMSIDDVSIRYKKHVEQIL